MHYYVGQTINIVCEPLSYDLETYLVEKLFFKRVIRIYLKVKYHVKTKCTKN